MIKIKINESNINNYLKKKLKNTKKYVYHKNNEIIYKHFIKKVK
jgi:hypothetical protein